MTDTAELTAAFEAAMDRALRRMEQLRSEPSRRWMTLEEAADHLRVSVSTARKSLPRWIARGLIARRERKGGPWIVDRESLDRMVVTDWR